MRGARGVPLGGLDFVVVTKANVLEIKNKNVCLTIKTLTLNKKTTKFFHFTLYSIFKLIKMIGFYSHFQVGRY